MRDIFRPVDGPLPRNVLLISDSLCLGSCTMLPIVLFVLLRVFKDLYFRNSFKNFGVTYPVFRTDFRLDLYTLCFDSFRVYLSSFLSILLFLFIYFSISPGRSYIVYILSFSLFNSTSYCYKKS